MKHMQFLKGFESGNQGVFQYAGALPEPMRDTVRSTIAEGVRR
jgi:hypothetical protein